MTTCWVEMAPPQSHHHLSRPRTAQPITRFFGVIANPAAAAAQPCLAFAASRHAFLSMGRVSTFSLVHHQQIINVKVRSSN